jgi:hypothetical protein
MSKKRAFVRYSKQGKIVPGSLILTGGSYPNGPATWNEIPADLCCEETSCYNIGVVKNFYHSDTVCTTEDNRSFIIFACNGKLVIKTYPELELITDNYLIDPSNSIQYIVKDSVITELGPICP